MTETATNETKQAVEAAAQGQSLTVATDANRQDVLATTATVDNQTPKEFSLSDAVAQWAGKDESKLNNLKNYKDVNAMFGALDTLKRKINAGLKRGELSATATDEEKAEYRKANGIPDAHADYLKNLPNGLVIAEEDAPIFDEVMQILHTNNVAPAVAHGIAKWYYDFAEKKEAAELEANNNAKAQTNEVLMQEWGIDHVPNKNIIANVIQGMSPELLGTEEAPGPIWQAALPDGTQLMNNPDFARWMLQIGKELKAPSTSVSNNNTSAPSINTRIAELYKMSGNYHSDYWKGPNAEALQKEYRDLLAKQASQKGGLNLLN